MAPVALKRLEIIGVGTNCGHQVDDTAFFTSSSDIPSYITPKQLHK
jgi:hypothetical protein